MTARTAVRGRPARTVSIPRRGGVEHLRLRRVCVPPPLSGHVRVRVEAAGLNHFDVEFLHSDALWQAYSGELREPAVNGADFAGVVDAVGAGAPWRVGDRVFGRQWFAAQAEYTIVDGRGLSAVPAGLAAEIAGGLATAARAALASVAAVRPSAGETVFVSAAAGGVGLLAAQLAQRAGARVIGSASLGNHEFLAARGIRPVLYGAGLVARVRALAPSGLDAVLDNHGRETLRMASALGVPPSRINSVADRPFAADLGASGVCGDSVALADVGAVAQAIAAGEIVFPVAGAFPLESVRAAYDTLAAGHARGKLVLLPHGGPAAGHRGPRG